MNAELKEKIAKAMHASVIGDLFGRTESQLLAGIAISAIEAAGYVVVPREPTGAMVKAGTYPAGGGAEAEAAWQAMIEAVEQAE